MPPSMVLIPEGTGDELAIATRTHITSGVCHPCPTAAKVQATDYCIHSSDVVKYTI